MAHGKHNRQKREHLALHVASGGSVAAFARDQGIPRRTCYLWTKEAGFTSKVSGYRDRILDKLVGRLAKLGGKAVSGIGVLAAKSESESIRLAACRAILSDLISIGTYTANARQFAAMETRLDALERTTNAESNRPPTITS
jgi:hypothetical protein